MNEELDKRTPRIRYQDDVRYIYDKVHGSTNVEQTPFPQIKDVFVFAACLGFNKKNRKELQPGKKGDLRQDVFSDKDKDIFKAIAIAETRDITILEKRPEELISGNVITIVEEYANGGILELKQILDEPGYTLDNLIALILNI